MSRQGSIIGTWANVVIDLRMGIPLHVILLVVPIVFACPAAWGIGNLHQTAAVEEEPCPSAVGSMSPGAVDLVEEEAFFWIIFLATGIMVKCSTLWKNNVALVFSSVENTL